MTTMIKLLILGVFVDMTVNDQLSTVYGIAQAGTYYASCVASSLR